MILRDLIISNEIDSFDKEKYINVSGYNLSITTQSIDNLTDSLALEFTPWNEWLGMKIDQNSLKNFNQLELICHCLHEITYMGFSQKEIEKEWQKINKTVDDFKHMSKEEKERSSMTLDELKKEYKYKDK